MNFRKIPILLLLCAGLVALLSSCKEDEETVKNSFTGNISFTLPTYCKAGDAFSLKPNTSGISRSDGGDIGYFWRATPGYTANDTTKFEGSSVHREFNFVIPDTLCTVTVTCTAFADGYYNTQGSRTMTIVSDTESLTGMEYREEQPFFVDARDGKQYPYATIAGMDWMSSNLAYEGTGTSFLNSGAVDNIFGRFYTFTQAQQACPEGWTLPSEDDWKALAECLGSSVRPDLVIPSIAGSLMVDAYFNDNKMWDYWPGVDITNTTGLGVIPLGYVMNNSSSGSFAGFGTYAALWTSTPAAEGDNVIYRYIYQDKPDVFPGLGDRNALSLNVRCIRPTP